MFSMAQCERIDLASSAASGGRLLIYNRVSKVSTPCRSVRVRTTARVIIPDAVKTDVMGGHCRRSLCERALVRGANGDNIMTTHSSQCAEYILPYNTVRGVLRDLDHTHIALLDAATSLLGGDVRVRHETLEITVVSLVQESAHVGGQCRLIVF